MQRPVPAMSQTPSHLAVEREPLATEAYESLGAAVSPPAARSRWRWIGLAAVACVLEWLALGAGIWLKVSTGTMFVLATLAAVTTEGTVWLAALMLGVNAYQARRQLWQKLRRFFR